MSGQPDATCAPGERSAETGRGWFRIDLSGALLPADLRKPPSARSSSASCHSALVPPSSSCSKTCMARTRSESSPLWEFSASSSPWVCSPTRSEGSRLHDAAGAREGDRDAITHRETTEPLPLLAAGEAQCRRRNRRGMDRVSSRPCHVGLRHPQGLRATPRLVAFVVEVGDRLRDSVLRAAAAGARCVQLLDLRRPRTPV
jgi:hypothetical protein